MWIAGSVLWLGGRIMTNFGDNDQLGGVDVVPLQGAIVVCYDWGKVTDNFGAVNGAIAGCHCSVLRLGGRVTINFRGVDVVLLLVAGGGDDQFWGSGRGAFDNTKIVFCFLGSMLVEFIRYNLYFSIKIYILYIFSS